MALFGDLSYAKKTLKPIGRPVDDLRDLYAKKGEDYNYVVDSLNTAKTALNNLPYEDKDKAIVDAAKQKYQDTFDAYEKEGDFENKVIDTKNLATAMANDYGLKEVQTNSLNRTAMIADLKDRVAKEDITSQQMNNAIKDSDRNYKGVQQDTETGQYSGNYTPTNVQNYISASKEVADVLKGWKANTIALKDKQGRELKPQGDGRTGYLESGTVKYVSDAELRAAAIRHVKSDPAIQSQFAQDTYFEMQNLLHDAEGNKREMATNDIRNLMLKGVSKDLADHLGVKTVKDLTNLDEVLKGQDLESVYRMIKDEQMTNDAIALGVSKESYEEYDKDYKKDWMAEFKMEQSAKTNTSPEGILTPYSVQDNLNSENLQAAANLYTTSKTALEDTEAKLATELAKGGAGNPYEVKQLKESIRRNKQTIANVENRGNALIENNKEVRELIDNTLNGATFVPKADAKSLRGEKIHEEYEFGINGLSINRTSFQRLIWKDMDDSLYDEDVQKFINLDLNTYLDQARNTLTKEMEGVKDVNNVDVVGNQAFEEEVVRKGTKLYDDAVAKEGNKLRNRINYASNLIETKADKGEVKTTETFKTFTLPEMSAKDENAHPIFQLNSTVANLPGATGNWMDGFAAIDGQTIVNFIEEEFDVEDVDGEIKWEDAKMQSTIDVRPDKNGIYQPVVLMSVPVKNDDASGYAADRQYKTVDVAVHNSNTSYTKKYVEAMNSYKQKLKTKASQSSLSSSEQDILDRINLNLYNLSDYAQNIDNAGLYDGVEGDKNITWWDGNVAQVSVYNGNSPGNFGYLLTKGEGDNKTYYGTKDGQSIQEYSYEEIESPYSGVTPLGANSVTDLKTLFGNMVDTYNLNQSTSEDSTKRDLAPAEDSARRGLLDTFFMGQEPQTSILSKGQNYVDKLLTLTKEQQATLGIHIVDNKEDNLIEITKI